MKLQRAVGQTSQILLLFVQDASVTTGAGLANVIGSSVSYTWFHNTQISVSSGTASTAGTTGTYSTSAWVMISSSNALGWYQFGAPDGVFGAGDSVGIHFYGAPNMVPLPVEIELVRDNPLQFTTSKVFLAHTSTSPADVLQIYSVPAVTSASGQFKVSTQALNHSVNVTSYQGSAAVTSVAGMPDVNLERVHTAAIVTTVAGVLDVNVIRYLGGTVVTTVAGYPDVNIERLHGASLVTTVAGVMDVNLERIHGGLVTTTGTGIMIVTTQTIDKTGYSLTAAERAAIMTVIDTTVVGESYRASSDAGTMTQLMYEVLANVTDFTNSGTTRALNSVTSHATGTLQYQYDSTTPSAITRIA